MKINLLLGTGTTLSDFVNINALENDCRVDNLDGICESAECEMLVAEDIIDYLSSKEVDSVIEHWISKLRHKATIVIGGTDIYEVSKALYLKQIDMLQANILLFGEQNEPWQFKHSALTSYEVVKALESCGLKILKKRINNYKYVIEAQRP